MDYTREFKQFITGQYLSFGVRITISVLGPAIVLYNMGLLSHYMAIPMGALCVALTDNPGPPLHRRNGILISIILNFLVALLTNYTRSYYWFIALDIVLFGMLFTMLSVFGSRAQSIGSIALTVFIFNLNSQSSSLPGLDTALLFTAGGIWYALICSVQYTLRPYRILQQKIGECVIDTAKYLQVKANFYTEDPDYEVLTDMLIKYQVKIQGDHAELREMLFKTRRVVNEPTSKSRILMLMFLDSIDLFERIMTSQQHYKALHNEFDETGILKDYYNYIMLLVHQLQEIGVAIQGGSHVKTYRGLKDELRELKIRFREVKESPGSHYSTDRINDLYHILHNLQDITERIIRLGDCTTFDKKIERDYKPDIDLDLEKFITHQSYNPQLLLDNFSLKSSTFRHAFRLTVALLLGYAVSLIYPVGHSYWILLTIATIIRPAYSLTRERNLQRMVGTFLGGLLGFACFYFMKGDDKFLFVIMLFSMILSYSFLKLQYLVFTTSLTLYVLLSFYFLSPTSFTDMLTDRLIDTGIGSVIAFVVALFVLPTWEHQQMGKLIKNALETNRAYFDTVATAFIGQNVNITEFKVARKNAFVALANISDNLQRMLSEPKDKRRKLLHYHQFVASTHVLTAHIAALSYYGDLKANSYASPGFQVLIGDINHHFDMALHVLDDESPETIIHRKPMVTADIYQLFEEQSRTAIAKNLKAGTEEMANRFSDIHTIIHQFELINTMVNDEVRIIRKIVIK